jgi:ribosomal protein S18 acetylase RimI-like enzyme
MTSFSVRPAARQDIGAIVAIHASASRGAGLLAPPGAMAGATNPDKPEAHWRDAIEFADPQLIVACDADVVVGVVGFDRCRDKGTPPTLGEIWTLQVAPSHWGRGVGLALWDAAREGLADEGCTEVSVWTELGAERALRFFDLAGFKRVMSSAQTATLAGVRVEQIRLKRKL